METTTIIETPEAIQRLKRDLVTAAATLSVNEVRYLVDAYYAIQESRKAAGNQVRALAESKEPHTVIL
jgi:phosphatidylserine/phosphatidylglycerophosphate/cardiolipin synthase-like enzyme